MVKIFFIPDLRTIVQGTRDTQAQAFASGIWNNLLTQLVKYLQFCITFNLITFPAKDSVLAWYAQFLSYNFKMHAAIVNYLGGIKTLHLLLDMPVAMFRGFLVKLTVQGIRKIKGIHTKQAAAMNPITLHHIFQTLNLALPDNATFWALCLVMFFLLRKSNVVVDSFDTFEVSKLLCLQDI